MNLKLKWILIPLAGVVAMTMIPSYLPVRAILNFFACIPVGWIAYGCYQKEKRR